MNNKMYKKTCLLKWLKTSWLN